MSYYKQIQILLIGFVLLSTACHHQTQEKIMIATAANMQFAMKTLSEAFTKQNKIECEVVISSSGKLTAQIIAGAPYDVFVAADKKYPEEIFNSGLAKDAPKIYAYGKLVLWSKIDKMQPSIELLSDNSIQHIAIANPKTAPYGAAALEVLQHYNLHDQLKEKLVYGESIAQTNRFISSKSAELGFTAMSVVLSPQMKEQGQWIELEDDLYNSIEQAVVLLKHENGNNLHAQQFYEFLFSKKAKKILKDFGYLVDE